MPTGGQSYLSQPQPTKADSGRIGLGYVNAFLEKGFLVIAAARDPSKLLQHENIIPVKIDALDSEGPIKVFPPSKLVLIRQAIEELKAKGIERIDIVLANAGVFPDGKEGMFKDLTAKSAEEVWRVNVSPYQSRELMKRYYPL